MNDPLPEFPEIPAAVPEVRAAGELDPLARVRHDLRTPASHILGYAEMLQEQARELGLLETLPDLQRIETAGRHLADLIRDELSPERLADPRAQLRDLQAAFRTPLNHVRGYTEILLETADAPPRAALASDLGRIYTAANTFLRLMEGWFTPALLAAARSARPTISRVAHPDALALSRTPPSLRQVRTAAGGRILVVDDDPGNRDLLTRRLEQQGFRVLAVASGEEALQQLRQEPFDLLLLDVVMPGIDGDEVLACLKQDPVLRHLPVIMLSALDEMDLVVRCILAGAEDYLAKPVNTVLLRARIGACLEQSRLRQQEAAYLAALEAERQKSESLLLNILPADIAARLKGGETTIVDSLPEVTVLFADLVGFTTLATRVSPVEMVRLLDEIFSAFDGLAEAQGLEKIKTIGDAYMVVGGLPTPRPDHAEAVAEVALDMIELVERRFTGAPVPVRIRVGINTGPVIAGIIGRHKFNYDLWGDTVNTASRMESHGLPGRIQVAAATRDRLATRYTFEERGLIEVKGKGPIPTWFLTGRGQ